MKTIRGALIDADYITKGNRAIIRLTLKRKRFFRLYDESFEPYFYLQAENLEEAKTKLEAITQVAQGETVKVKRIEKIRKLLFSKETELLKVYCFHPSHVPILRDQVRGIGTPYEHDIRFARRYIIDKGLTPFNILEIEKEGKFIKSIKDTGEPNTKLNTLAFDIETYNPQGSPRERKDPAIMVSYAVMNGPSGVLTYKETGRQFAKNLGSEKEMIDSFTKLVKDSDIELLLGYNSTSFDLPYLKARAEANGTKLALGRDGTDFRARRRGMFNEAKITGRLHVDLYPVVRFLGIIGALRIYKFTLENAYAEITGKKKLMVSKLGIWQMWDSDSERAKLADYSLGDAQSTLEIGQRVMPMEIEISRLVRVPLFDIAGISTGHLVELFLTQSSFDKGMIVPNRPREEEVQSREGYMLQGAYVRIPNPGIYDNIAVFDFRGLYPSIITSYNIDPDMIDCGCCPGSEAHLSPSGSRFCKKRVGHIPEVLGKIVEHRTQIKRKIKTIPKDSEEYAILNARQQALKVLANSFYGMLAYARSRWYSKECGEAVTSFGRHYIQETAKKAEESGFEVLYGDSITSDRFVTILDPHGIIRIQNIEELFEKHKQNLRTRGEKEAISLSGYKALTLNPKTRASEWKKISEVIRHKAGKRIFRISQKYGETIATEDHSIMVEKGKELIKARPEEMRENHFVKVTRVPKVKPIRTMDVYEWLRGISYEITYKGRKKLLCTHTDKEFVWFGWTNRKIPVKVRRYIQTGSPAFLSLCRLLGAYIPEGSSSTPNTTKSRLGASISSSDRNWLAQLKGDYEALFVNARASVIQSTRKPRDLKYSTQKGSMRITYSDNTHKLQMMNSLAAVFFKGFCGQKSTGKKIPAFIFHVPEKHKLLLLEQMIKGDGTHTVNNKLGYSKEYIERNFRYATRSLGLVGGVSLLLTQLGRNHYITYRPLKRLYTLGTSDRDNSTFKTKLIEEKYEGYVYDLSVEDNHTFVDSCGQVLLHNTDSIFLIYKGKTREQVMDFLAKTNSDLPGNMELELEGFYSRGLFVTKKTAGKDKDGGTGAKKKYALMGEDGNIKIRGFELVRRDWSPIAKKTQLKVLEAILKDGSKEKAVSIVKETIEALRAGSVPLQDLVITNQIKKKFEQYEIISPEVIVAEKLRE
ncbi:MAG: DNA polymerase domain-containing protein, partial [Candidatus Micrarchaeota archaeon]